MFSYATSLVLLALSIMSVASSQLILKWRLGDLTGEGDGRLPLSRFIWAAVSDVWVWAGGALIIVSAAMWYAALTRLPLSFMMPAAALIAPITVIFAYFLLREPVSLGQASAILVITAGVAWLSYQQ
ncbi:hypothetical protein B7H23_07075 [Notoacmeibacter marinus]|uniref:EamA domain-containing protein n=1 Tax=Notoacmeibacter marinus TaxID=1876515 RepID=A0A231V384_9HYPH|nr:hypothetical protein B7H23_07075 [Notoacmeibacter marinus]